MLHRTDHKEHSWLALTMKYKGKCSGSVKGSFLEGGVIHGSVEHQRKPDWWGHIQSGVRNASLSYLGLVKMRTCSNLVKGYWYVYGTLSKWVHWFYNNVSYIASYPFSGFFFFLPAWWVRQKANGSKMTTACGLFRCHLQNSFSMPYLILLIYEETEVKTLQILE